MQPEQCDSYSVDYHGYFDTRLSRSSACWLWCLTPDVQGYGKASYLSRTFRAHRLAYELAIGPVSADLIVHHACEDTYAPGDKTYRLCCNPAHLELVSHADNMRAMAATGRAARGDRHGRRLHPETIPYGDRSGARAHPERLARGDRNGSRLYPERLTRGDDPWTRRYPERRVRGERHAGCTISDDQVRAIRSAHAAGMSYRRLAVQFGVSKTSIARIVKRKGRTDI